MKYRNISTGAYVQLQKAKMQNFINTLSGSESEAESLQQQLNTQLSLVRNTQNITANSAIIEQFLNKLGEAMQIEITNSLNMTDASKESKSGAVSGSKARAILEKISKRDKMFNSIVNPNATTVRKSDVESVLRKLEYVRKSNIGDTLALKKLREIEKELQTLYKQIEASGSWHKIGRGFNLSLDSKQTDSGKIAWRINKLLSYANALITVGDVSSEIGVIGEQSIAAMLSIIYAKKEELNEDFINTLVKGFLGGSLKTGGVQLSNGIKVSIVGDEKSRKGYYSNTVSKFTSGATQSGHFVSFNATDDKVDIQIEIPNENRTITASVKNYSNLSSVTLLTGNIFPILVNYHQFMQHYLKLISSTHTPQEDLGLMYQGIKFTTGIHALVGGVKALASSGNVITTPTAQYFIVNNNRAKNNGISVYSTKSIALQILENVDLIDLINGNKIGDKIESKADMVRGKILNHYDNIADVDNRFASITVELKLNQIKQSINKI